MKRILLSLALLGAVATTQAQFTPAEEAAMNIAFPESAYDFVIRNVSEFLSQSGTKLSGYASQAGTQISDYANRAGAQIADYANNVYDVVSREASVAANEPAAQALVKASQYAQETAQVCSAVVKEKSAEMFAQVKEAAPHLPQAAFEVAKNNKYTIALVALVAGSYGVYKIATMKKTSK